MNNNIVVNMKFNADTSQAKAQMQQLQNSLNQIMNMNTGSIGKNMSQVLIQDLKAGQQAAAQLQANLQSAFNADTGKLDLTKFTQQMKQSGMNLNQYKAQLNALGPTGQQAFTQLTQSIAQAEVPLLRVSKGMHRLASTFANTARYQLSASLLSGFTSAISTAYNYAQDLNESLNNIRIVTGYNAERMSDFAKEANKAAKALSTTTTAYTDASLIYFQQGLNDQQVKERTDTTIKLANVTGQDVQTVSDQLTAIWNNFADGSKELEYYADVITKLGAATASSTDEISDGLEKFAAVSETVGLSYEMATAALATVTAETRQSADVVGTAFKTIFSRMEGLKLGETLDDGTTLNQYSSALATAGVNIKDQNGQLKEMDDILNDLGAKWGTLNKDTQIALAQSVAGVRQYNQFIALMGNWDKVQENLDVAANSTGELNTQADIYAESWEAARDRVTASLETIYSQLLDDDFFIGLTNFGADFLDTISNIIESLGGLQGVLLLLGNLITRIFREQLVSGFTAIQYSFMSLTKSGRESLYRMKTDAVSSLQEMYTAQSGSTIGGMQGQAASAMAQSSNTVIQAEQEGVNGINLQALKIMDQQVQMEGQQLLKLAEELKILEKQNAERQKYLKFTEEGKEKLEVYNKAEGNEEENRAAAREMDLIAEESGLDIYRPDNRATINGPSSITFNSSRKKESVAKSLVEKGATFAYQAGVGSAIQDEKSGFMQSFDDIDTTNIEKVEKVTESLITKSQTLKKTIGDKGIDLVGDRANKAINNYDTALGKISGKAKNVKNLQSELSNLTEGTNDYTKKENELLTAQKDLDDAIGKVTKESIEFGAAVTENTQKADDYYGAAGRLGAEVEGLSDEQRKAGQATGDLITGTSNLTLNQEKNAESAQRAKMAQMGLGQSLVSLANIMMTVGMVFSSFKGLFDTWNNEDLSMGDKLIATFTTLGMVIPMVTSAFNAQSLARLSSLSSIIAHILGLQAEKLAYDAATGSITTATGAAIGFGTALQTVLLPIGLAIAAITALVSIVMLLVNASKNAQANSLEGQVKALNEQMKALNTSLDETKQRVDNINSAFETWESAYDKINTLAQGTAEWNLALLESNIAMQKLLELIPQLRTEGLVYTDENGALTLKPEAKEFISSFILNQLATSQKAAGFGQFSYNVADARLDKENSLKETLSVYSDSALKFLKPGSFYDETVKALNPDGSFSIQALNTIQSTANDLFKNEMQKILSQNNQERKGDIFESSKNEDMEELKDILKNSSLYSEIAYEDQDTFDEFIKILNESIEIEKEYTKALTENTKQLIDNNLSLAQSILSNNDLYKNETNMFKKQAMEKVFAAEAAKSDLEYITLINKIQGVGLDEGESRGANPDIGTLESITVDELVKLLGEDYRKEITDLAGGGSGGLFEHGGVDGLDYENGTELGNYIFKQYRLLKEERNEWQKNSGVAQDFYEYTEEGELVDVSFTKVGESETTEQTINLVTMLTELAAAHATEAMEEADENIAKRISQWSETQAKIALGQIDTLTEAEMDQYFTETGVGADGFKTYAFDENTKLSDDDIKDMAAAAGYIDEEGLVLVEEFEKHLADQVEKYNAGTAAANRYVNAVSEMNAEMDAQAESLGTTADALKDYTKYLFESRKANINWSEDMGEAYRQAANYTLALAEMNQGFKELNEALDDNIEELKQWNEEGDYSLRAMEKAAKAAEGLSKVLGVDVDGGFVLDNINLIEELMQGSTIAAEQLQNQLQEFYTNSLSITNEARDELNNSLNNIKAGVNTEEAIQKLNELMREGDLTQEQVKDSLASIGYTPDIRTVPITTSSTTTSTITEIGADGKPTGKVLKQISVNENKTKIPYIATSKTYTPTVDTGEDENGKTSETITYATGSGLTKNNIDLATAATSWEKDQENEEKASNKEDVEDLEIEGYEDQRYIKRNNNIEKINNSLAKQERLTNKLSGNKKLDSMEKEVKILKKLSEEQGKLTAETRGYLELDRTNLIDKIGKKAKFDKDGQLLNEEELKRYYQGIVIRAQKAYKASATNANKEALEEAEKERDEIFELIDTYQGTYKEAADNEMAYLESQDAIIEASTNTFLEALDQKAEAVDRFNDKIDRTLKLLEIKLKDLEDKDYSGAQAAVLVEQSIVTSVEKAIKDQQTYLDAQADYESIKDGYDENGNPVGQESIDAAFDRMLEAGDNMLDSAQTLKEYEDQLDELLISHLDEQKENFAEVSDELEHYSGVLEHYNNILDLTGAKVQSNDVLLEIADAQVQNAKTQLQTSKAKFDTLSKELAQAQTAGASEEIIQDLTQRVREAQQEMLSDLADGLQAAADKYATTIEVAAKEAEEALLKNSKYNSLEDAQQAFDQQQELNDLYVEEYDKLYQLNKLTRDINKSMADSDSLLANRELSTLLDEINEKRESGVEMSQYELDNLQRKYDLRLAEIALEEAQDTKDSMRLTRDSQGNWTYTYTADQNKVQEAEQQYEDALYNMQQSTEEYLDQLQANILQTQSEMIEAIQNLRVEDFASVEEYEQAVEQIRKFYSEKNLYYYDQIEKALDSHNIEMERSVDVYTGSMNNSLNTIGDAYGRQVLTFKDLVLAEVTGVTTVDEAVNGFTDSVNGYLEAAKTAFDNYKKAQEGVLSIVELNFSTTAGFINSDLNDINTNTETLGKNLDSLKSKAEAGFDGVLKAVQKIKAQYATEMDELIGKAQTLYEYLTTKYDVPEVSNPPKDDDPGTTKQTSIDALTKGVGNAFAKGPGDAILKGAGNALIKGAGDAILKGVGNAVGDLGANDKTYKVEQIGTHDNGYAAVKLDNGKWYDARAVLNGTGDIGDIVYDRIIKERNINSIKEKRIDNYTLSIPRARSNVSITRYTPAGGKVIGVLPLDITSGAGPFEITGAKKGENGWIYRMKYAGDQYVDPALRTLYINNNDLNKLRGTSGISYGDQHKFAKYDTGGYTGEWGPEGKWAMLHEKELILNKDQTSDFLNSLEIMSHIVDAIDRNSKLAVAGLAIDKASAAAITERVIQQTVSIEANFPGVTSAIEIEDALNNIINDAAQYAATRK